MAGYVKVVNNQIVSNVMSKVPSSIRLEDGRWVTGTGKLTATKLKSYGYYKVVLPTPPAYDTTLHDIRYTDVLIINVDKTVSPEYQLIDKVVDTRPVLPESNFDSVQITNIVEKIVRARSL